MLKGHFKQQNDQYSVHKCKKCDTKQTSEKTLIYGMSWNEKAEALPCSTSAGKAFAGNSDFLLLFEWLQKYCDYLLIGELQTHFSK